MDNGLGGRRRAEDWFSLYGESHRNPTNKLIHWICIPLILMSTLGMIQSIPSPLPAPFDWGVLAALASLVFYVRLSLRIAGGMVLMGGGALLVNGLIRAADLPLLGISLAIFGAAWVAQFIGHKIEGKKPSFFQDLQFLLVGPAWLVNALLGNWGHGAKVVQAK